MSDLKSLSIRKQNEFSVFYDTQIQTKLRPVFADLSLLSVLIGALFNLSILAKQVTPIHPLNYVYCVLIVLLCIANRIMSIRHANFRVVYATFSTVAVFSYLHFLAVGGGIEPIFGLFFFLASLGFITISIKHTLIILFVNLIMLALTCLLLYGANRWVDEYFMIMTNWFVFMCMLIAPATAVFSRWLYRNLYAMQYMLNDKNEILSETFKTLKATEELLIQEQKHQALSHMANGLLHEIINPVNTSTQALGFAKTINENREVNAALDDVIAEQLRISDIVTDLRKFSRPDEHHPLECVNLKILLEKAIKFCQSELNSGKVNVLLQVESDQQINCHPSAMTQVFVNIILNSCSALNTMSTRKISRPVIVITSEQRSDTHLIYFKDNGPGIHEDLLERITQPFYSDKTSPEKLGLGLTICQTIMRHHGGRFEVMSQLNEGTSIQLTLNI